MQLRDIATTFTLSHLPESEAELRGDVPYEAVAPYREKALAHIAAHLEMPGFRPGKVPTTTALQKVGEVAVLEEAVELFIKDFYPELVEAHQLDVVGRPDIRITKLAPHNPVSITIRTALYPEVRPPEKWKKLHESIPAETTPPATDEEVDKTLEDLRKSRAKNSEGLTSAEGAEDRPPQELPELNDEFAKSVGAFDSLEALTEQIRKGITEEKARRARDSRRGKLIEALLASATIAVPRVFVESELDKIVAQMRDDAQRFGMTLEQYLERVQKTEEVLRGELREQATKRAKLQLLLNKLAEEEKVEPDPSAVADEMKHALEHFPDAKPELVKIHIETVLRNEIVLKRLEGEQ